LYIVILYFSCSAAIPSLTSHENGQEKLTGTEGSMKIFRRKSTILIQRKLRGTILRNDEMQEFLEKKKAAGNIQEIFRGYLRMKQERREFLEKKKSVILIQQVFRGFLKLREERELDFCCFDSLVW
jgi:hypothetical protein